MARVVEPLDQQELELGDNEQLVDLLSQEDNTQEVHNQEQTADASQETEQVQEVEKPTEVDLPDKYKGKKIEEIVQMHQEVEKLVGRQSNEMGELRKIVDDFIKDKNNEVKEKPKEERIVDFFEDPETHVDARINNNPELKEVKELLVKQQQNDVVNRLQSKFPDYVQTIQDGSFIDWVKDSKVRIELLQRADQYDFDAADELLSTWSERKDNMSKAKEVNKKDRKQQVKAASTGGKGSGEPMSRKIYRRSDIVNLMMTDPDRYYANVEEFDRAYAEGRVK
jgi:hypothetical protein